MKRKIIVLIMTVMLSIMISGCGDKTIDATNDETLKASIANVKSGMSSEKKKEFEKAIAIIAFSDVKNIFSIALDPEGMIRRSKDKMHGKTADQIIKESKSIQKKRESEKKRSTSIRESAKIESLTQEISRLKNEIDKIKIDQGELGNFPIFDAKIYYLDNEYIREPKVDLTVLNNTEYAISRIVFKGEAYTKGRTIPWMHGTIDHSIDGGIEPNEEVILSMHTSLYKGWSSIHKDKKNMLFKAEVVTVYGANGEVLFDISELEKEEKALKRLSKKLVELEK